MAAIFDRYPEVVLFYATYRLNDRRMPLSLMLVIDGEGETEVACFWLTKSENKQAAEAMLDSFKRHNENWEKIKVVISKY